MRCLVSCRLAEFVFGSLVLSESACQRRGHLGISEDIWLKHIRRAQPQAEFSHFD